MFDIGWTELFVLGVLALLVFGPHELPILLRRLGALVRRLRQSAEQFRYALDDIATEIDTPKDIARKLANDVTTPDPANPTQDNDRA